MRFSGHETFSIREGWLYKGLSELDAKPNLFELPLAHDQLGVGSNMGKSIKHWLAATGLATRTDSRGKLRSKTIDISDFGRLVLAHDPFFNDIATWALLHVNLVNSTEATGSWTWFFQHCGETTFTRNQVAEQLNRWVGFQRVKRPSATTLQKDLNCLLASYAQKVPFDNFDPEEAMDCPLWDLGLLSFYRGAQSFRANRNAKEIPGEILGYALALSVIDDDKRDKRRLRQITFEDAATLPTGPGRAFLIGPSALYETIARSIEEYSGCGLQIDSQAGQRVIKFKNWTPLEWVATYYDRTKD